MSGRRDTGRAPHGGSRAPLRGAARPRACSTCGLRPAGPAHAAVLLGRCVVDPWSTIAR